MYITRAKLVVKQRVGIPLQLRGEKKFAIDTFFFFFLSDTVTQKINVLLFDYDNRNKKKYTRFYHDTRGLTHFKSSPTRISLQVVKNNPELHMLTNQTVLDIDSEGHVITILSKNCKLMA